MEDDGLGSLERRIMKVLWEHGALTPRETLERLDAEGGRELAYTTVMTVLVRLTQKGYVDREPEGRAFRYAARVRDLEVRDVAGMRALDRLLERYGAANVARFAAELGPHGAELIERLRALSADESDESGATR